MYSSCSEWGQEKDQIIYILGSNLVLMLYYYLIIMKSSNNIDYPLLKTIITKSGEYIPMVIQILIINNNNEWKNNNYTLI